MRKCKQIFVRLGTADSVAEQGRLLFSVASIFAGGGYRVQVLDRFGGRELEEYGKLASSLEGVSMVDSVPDDTENWVYLFDRYERSLGALEWCKEVHLRFDIFSSFRFGNPIIMPYPMHPVHCDAKVEEKLLRLGSKKKSIRVLFSGDIKGYVRNRIFYPKEKLTRSAIVEYLREKLGDDLLLVDTESGIDALFESERVEKCVIIDTRKVWVDDRRWLDLLARVEFFISPPGYVMPMCHNIVEAMALGSIPITNYSEWFDPGLTHMLNCIEFDDRVDLLAKVRGALRLSDDEVSKLRDGVRAYYEAHLVPARFLEKFEAMNANRIQLLLYTEDNVVQNGRKLNRNSILMRGTAARHDSGGGLGALLGRLKW